MKLSLLAVMTFPVIMYAILHLVPFQNFESPAVAWGLTFAPLLFIEALLILRFAMKLPKTKN